MSAAHDVAAIFVVVECSCGKRFTDSTEDVALERLLEHRKREESKRSHPTTARSRSFSAMPHGGQDDRDRA